MKERSALWTVYPVMVVTTFFWAFGHPLGRIILRSVHQIQLGSINLIIWFLILLAYLALTGKTRSPFLLPARDLLASISFTRGGLKCASSPT